MAAHEKSKIETVPAKGTLSEQAEYERGFIDGMQKQMQSSVDKAVNRMATPQQIEKLEAQLGEAVWNYGEAKRLNAQLLDALENLLWYVEQLEMIVYSSDDTSEHEEVTKARAAVAAAKGEA